jgi:hypothetical protein
MSKQAFDTRGHSPEAPSRSQGGLVVLRESNSPERVGQCNVVPSAHFFGNMKDNVKGKKRGIDSFFFSPMKHTTHPEILLNQPTAKANRSTQSNTKLPNDPKQLAVLKAKQQSKTM